MGEYFKIVNPTKLQYIDALDFGGWTSPRSVDTQLRV